MNNKAYTELLNQVFDLINKKELKESLSLSRASERIDSVQDLIRNAIIDSSIGKYKGVPHFFNGRIYEEMHPDEFGNLIYDLMKMCPLPKGDYSRIEGIIRVCKRAIAGKELKPDSSIMVFTNCVLDTKTRKTHGFHPRFIQMTSVGYPYKKDDTPLQWQMFLNSVLPEKHEQKILQEALGCLLINREEAKMEHITFLYGTGANGKSVIFETVLGVFGKENISNYPLMSLIAGGDRKKNIASMDGLRANYCSESQQVNITKNEDGFKSLTSGEPTEARQIFGENFMAYNIPLQFVNVNRMPEISHLSNSLKRRIVIIDFKVEIPVHRQDKQLAQVFKKEYSGIFNWIMDGRDSFIKHKYDFSERKLLEEKLDEYQADCNSVIKFMLKMKYYRINKDITDTVPKWVSSKILFKRYEKWCLENEMPSENEHNFGSILRDAGYQKRRSSEGNLYAIYGSAVLSSLHYRSIISRRKNFEQDSLTPYTVDGKRYVNRVKGISAAVKVHSTTINRYYRGGFLEGCYELGGKSGMIPIFDIAATKLRLKELGVFKTDIEKAKEKAERTKASNKRGQINRTMKRHNSKKRVYASKVDEKFVQVLDKVIKEKGIDLKLSGED